MFHNLFSTKFKNFNFFLDTVPDHIVLKDVNSVYMDGNLAAAKLLGFKKHDGLIGITDYQIKCEAVNRADFYVVEDKKLIQLGTRVIHLRFDIYANNELKLLLCKKGPFRNEEGQVLGTYIRTIDISESKISNFGLPLLQMEELKNQFRKKHSIVDSTYYLHDSYPGFDLTNRESECLFYLIRGKIYA